MAREATPEEKAVFGHDVKIDPVTNQPIEQGIGSAQQPTMQHLQARLQTLELGIRHQRDLGIDPSDELRADYIKTQNALKAFMAGAQ
ncbi:MAG: hypothetical protein JSR78_15220 [Proteobacteria bacterium]|nr:hypothetical protein [Pseudomonadota bacterium]